MFPKALAGQPDAQQGMQNAECKMQSAKEKPPNVDYQCNETGTPNAQAHLSRVVQITPPNWHCLSICILHFTFCILHSQ
jgi:hypothetical protein